MTNETKLLTEAEWQRISAPLGLTSTIDQIANELRERGLIAPEPVDPLLIEAREIAASWFEQQDRAKTAIGYRSGEWDDQLVVEIALAALRRGMELASQTEAPRCPVPEGQTPLDDNLRHRYLDVIREGSDAFDSGSQSPYHGHSLEHCLHAVGWVQRDLRVALDKAKEKNAALTEQVRK